MSYQITITETCQVTKLTGKAWTVIDSQEVDRDNAYTTDPKEPKTRIKDILGYTPEIETTVDEAREVFKQTVDRLNLTSVIKAINNIE